MYSNLMRINFNTNLSLLLYETDVKHLQGTTHDSDVQLFCILCYFVDLKELMYIYIIKLNWNLLYFNKSLLTLS
jgi:hypothetical protein